MWTTATWIPRVLDAVGCSPSGQSYSTSALFLEIISMLLPPKCSECFMIAVPVLEEIKKRAASFSVLYENWWLLTCIWEINFCQIMIISYLGFGTKFYNFCLQFCRSSVGLHIKSEFSRSSVQPSVRNAVVVIRQSALFSSRDVTNPAAFCRLVFG